MSFSGAADGAEMTRIQKSEVRSQKIEDRNFELGGGGGRVGFLPPRHKKVKKSCFLPGRRGLGVFISCGEAMAYGESGRTGKMGKNLFFPLQLTRPMVQYARNNLLFFFLYPLMRLRRY